VCVCVRARVATYMYVSLPRLVGAFMRVRPCIVGCSACNACAPDCVICGISCSAKFFDIFSLMAQSLEKKNIFIIECALLFSLQFLPETFLILRRNERDIVLNVQTSSCKVRFLVKPEFSRQIFREKGLNIKFHQNPSSSSRFAPC
jgi:hypothetical protein